MNDCTDKMDERALWRSVIAQAIKDATGKVCNRLKQHEQDEARAWFRKGGKDFREVCEMADLDPDHVRSTMLAKIGDAPKHLSVVRRLPVTQPTKPKASKPPKLAKPSRPAKPQRRGKIYTANGYSLTLKEWSIRLGLSGAALTLRLKNGKTLDEAFVAGHSSRQEAKHFIEYEGERLSIGELSQRINISKGTIWYRIKNGWTDDEIVTTPLMKTGGRVANSADQLRTGAVPTARDSLEIGFF